MIAVARYRQKHPKHKAMNQTFRLWNSLEIVKLIVQGITPILILLIGLYVNRALKRFEHFQWRNQKLIEKRLQIFDDIAPHFNDLLCYFTYIGCWKDLTPLQAIQLKRSLDKKIYLAAPLFSPNFFSACMSFMNLCYETYTGWGRDAKLRTKIERRKQAAGNWETTWTDMFSDDPSDPNKIREAYQEIMKCFSEDIGLAAPSDYLQMGRMPTNIR